MAERGEDGVRMVPALTRWQRLGITTLFVVGVLVVGAAVFVWTGYYNISAKSAHWDITTEILETVRDQSIRARADDVPVPELDDPHMIALGREHYRGGCASCHGMPGEERNPVALAMLPTPPDLSVVLDHYQPSALFWLIDNGIKYTGMPSWPADGRSDEVWPVVAYLVEVNGARKPQPVLSDQSRDGEPIDSYGFHVLGECVRCHGDAQTPPVSALVPELAGQPVEYLTRALVEYREGARPSGYMIPAASALTDEQIAQLAAFYAEIPPRGGTQNPEGADLARGGVVALNGVPERDVPACVSCHDNSNPQFPNLAGQSRRYLEAQLELWRNGGRDITDLGQIMALVAQRMTAADIRDVSAYFASLPADVGENGQ